jgi:hypothetical protein
VTVRWQTIQGLLRLATHDLRGPLGTVMLNCELMRSSLAGHDALRQVAVIERSGHRIATLLLALEEIAGIDPERLLLERSAHEVEHWVKANLGDPTGMDGAPPLLPDLALQRPGVRMLCVPQRLLQAFGHLMPVVVAETPDGPTTLRAEDGPGEVRFTLSGGGHPAEAETDNDSRLRGEPALHFFAARLLVEAQGGTLSRPESIAPRRAVSFTLPIAP